MKSTKVALKDVEAEESLVTEDHKQKKNIPQRKKTTGLRSAIKTLHGEANQEEQSLLKYFKDKNYALAPAVYAYLRCIGDFQVDSKHHHLDIPVCPNQNGDFGKVDKNNHWKCMALPAPHVLAKAVVADLRYTTGVDQTRDWDLPVELRPDPYAPDPAKPDILVRPGLANLLGWNRATHLPTNQRVYIEDASITNNGFGGRGRDAILADASYHALILSACLPGMEERCALCRQMLLSFHLAKSCTECIEEYFETPRETLLSGIEIEVVTRW
ncbi:hypothetical protein KM043_013411 [Ampulex compressa]|nr:hypothetical protein KM043_013411 [Ampulex compressa]